MRWKHWCVGGVLCAAAATLACGDGARPQVDTTLSAGQAAGDTISAPASTFRGGTEPVEQTGPGTGVATLTAVRTAPRQAEPFERVVFEFAERLPGYRVAYANGPVSECGSGRAVQVTGDATLLVRLESAQAHAEREGAMQSTLAERDLRPDQPLVKQMTLTCDFEGQVAWAIGLAEQRPFRVMELQDPPRLVVDLGSSTP